MDSIPDAWSPSQAAPFADDQPGAAGPEEAGDAEHADRMAAARAAQVGARARCHRPVSPAGSSVRDMRPPARSEDSLTLNVFTPGGMVSYLREAVRLGEPPDPTGYDIEFV